MNPSAANILSILQILSKKSDRMNKIYRIVGEEGWGEKGMGSLDTLSASSPFRVRKGYAAFTRPFASPAMAASAG